MFSAEPEAVSCCSTSPTDCRPVRSISARLRVWIGTWPCISAVLMRVPVTWTLSRVRVGASGGRACAHAAQGSRSVLSASASWQGRGAGYSSDLSPGDATAAVSPCATAAWLLCKQIVKR